MEIKTDKQTGNTINVKKKQSKQKKQDKKHIETSKLVLMVVFIICIEILIYAQIVTLILRDSNALYSLIGVPVTLVPITLGYYWKSKAQNTKGGITYDLALKENSDDYTKSDELENTENNFNADNVGKG